VDFTNKNLFFLFEIFGEKFYITQTVLSTWFVMSVLIIFAVVVRIKLSKFKDKPTGFQNVVEAIVETINKFTVSTMGKNLEGFSGYFLAVFMFIILSNYSGLLGFRPPTADLATTGALAMSTFALIHITGIRKAKWGYLKGYFQPLPFFVVLNVLGELSKPISLAFRLFGNILAGLVIMGIVYQFFPFVLRFVVPAALHAWLDIFSGGLQAFIFTVLSMTFIAQMAETD